MWINSLCFILAAVVASVSFGFAPIAFIATIAIGFPAVVISSVVLRFVR